MIHLLGRSSSQLMCATDQSPRVEDNSVTPFYPQVASNSKTMSTEVAAFLETFDEEVIQSDADTSDGDDRIIFERPRGRLARDIYNDILRIKHNNTTYVYLKVNNINVAACERLGYILSQNNTLEVVSICRDDHIRTQLHGSLCIPAGVRSNRSIQELRMFGIPLFDYGVMILSPFLIENQNLVELELCRCDLDAAAINMLGSKLMERTADTIIKLNLSENFVEENELNTFVEFLNKSHSLKELDLRGNRITGQSARSLAMLIRSNESMLEHLDLRGNSITSEEALTLIAALGSNTKLKTLNLEDNNAIDDDGWRKVSWSLQLLVCNDISIRTVIQSNHTISSLGRPYDPSPCFTTGEDGEVWRLPDNFGVELDQYLGDRKTKLVEASLRSNHGEESSIIKARHKVFWGLTDGSLYLDASVKVGLVPRVLALLGNPFPCVKSCDHCHKASAKLFICQEENWTSPPPHAELRRIRLSTIYRIVQARPDLCLKRSMEKLLLEKLEDSESSILALHLENKCKEDEIKCLEEAIKSSSQESSLKSYLILLGLIFYLVHTR